MLKFSIEKLIQKLKNKDFKFDQSITTSMLLSLLFQYSMSLIRGLKFLNFKNRGLLLFLGQRVKFQYRGNIEFGDNVKIGDFSKLSGLGCQKLTIGHNVSIAAFSQIIISTSFNNIGKYIRIGDNVGIGEFAYIGGGGGAMIGKNTIIGQYFSIHPENHNFSKLKPLIKEQGVTREGVNIGENCWIGSKVTILDGVTVGSGCIIAAGAVLTNGEFENNSIIAGVPAKVIRKRADDG
ncbi:MAG: acetyltransferase [Hyphomicrobiales bacterium]|nr:MAG: acetyltransferase [Hyphomicrobiales bacterium]